MAERLALADVALGPGSVPDPDAPHLVLWNCADFYSLRSSHAQLRVQVDHRDGDRLVGSFVGGVDEGVAVSGFSAPFGGLDLVRSAETIANLADLVDVSMAALSARGCQRVEVRCKPQHYGPDAEALLFVLFNRGFEVASCELNSYLDLRHLSTVEDYVGSLKPAARKMYRRSAALGLDCFQVSAEDERLWAEAYEVLRRNRVDRGRPMRLDLDYIRAIRDAFPGAVRMLVATDGEQVSAAALVYRITKGHDLVQYWGHAGDGLSVSPMNVLVAGVVEHCLAGGASFIDVGIASENGVPNQGLIQFKRSVGCLIEPRFELVHTEDPGRS